MMMRVENFWNVIVGYSVGFFGRVTIGLVSLFCWSLKVFTILYIPSWDQPDLFSSTSYLCAADIGVDIEVDISSL